MLLRLRLNDETSITNCIICYVLVWIKISVYLRLNTVIYYEIILVKRMQLLRSWIKYWKTYRI